MAIHQAVIEFQSLIGRLKTFAEFVEKTVEKEFQSLIGRLKTTAFVWLMGVGI